MFPGGNAKGDGNGRIDRHRSLNLLLDVVIAAGTSAAFTGKGMRGQNHNEEADENCSELHYKNLELVLLSVESACFGNSVQQVHLVLISRHHKFSGVGIVGILFRCITGCGQSAIH